MQTVSLLSVSKNRRVLYASSRADLSYFVNNHQRGGDDKSYLFERLIEGQDRKPVVYCNISRAPKIEDLVEIRRIVVQALQLDDDQYYESNVGDAAYYRDLDPTIDFRVQKVPHISSLHMVKAIVNGFSYNKYQFADMFVDEVDQITRVLFSEFFAMSLDWDDMSRCQVSHLETDNITLGVYQGNSAVTRLDYDCEEFSEESLDNSSDDSSSDGSSDDESDVIVVD